jgi:hypothetical protein
MVPAPHQLSSPLAPVPAGGRHGTRQCSRPGCAEPASATLTYQYERGSGWVDPLLAEREPHAYDLCERHAGRVSVPRGWRLDDRRGLIAVPSPLPERPVGEPDGSLPAPLPQRLAG